MFVMKIRSEPVYEFDISELSDRHRVSRRWRMSDMCEFVAIQQGLLTGRMEAFEEDFKSVQPSSGAQGGTLH